MQILNLLRERHGLDLPDEQLHAIVNTCAEIIIVIDQLDYEDQLAAAIEEAGGCSRCCDLDGHSCTCNPEEDDYEHEEDICGNCGEIAKDWMLNGLCPTCHKTHMQDFVY